MDHPTPSTQGQRPRSSHLGLSFRADEEELAELGLTPKDLGDQAAAHATIEAARNAGPGDDQFMQVVDDFVNRFEDAYARCTDAYASLIRERAARLKSHELDEAVASGLVTVRSWEVDGVSPFAIALNGEDAYISKGMDDLAIHLATTRHAIMFEPGSSMMFSPARSGTKDVGTASDPARPDVAAIAASLMGFLPELREAKVGQILDLREELEDHLPAFRLAMVELTERIDQARTPVLAT